MPTISKLEAGNASTNHLGHIKGPSMATWGYTQLARAIFAASALFWALREAI